MVTRSIDHTGAPKQARSIVRSPEEDPLQQSCKPHQTTTQERCLDNQQDNFRPAHGRRGENNPGGKEERGMPCSGKINQHQANQQDQARDEVVDHVLQTDTDPNGLVQRGVVGLPLTTASKAM